MTVFGIDAPNADAAPISRSTSPWKQRALTQLQTRLGRLAMLGGFVAMMFGLRMPYWWQTSIVLALTSTFPAQRRWFITIAALWWIALTPPVSFALLSEFAPLHGAQGWIHYWPLAMAGAWAIAWGYLALVRTFPKSPIGRRPIVGLLLLYAAMLVTMSKAPLTGAAWFFVVVTTLAFGQYLWFFAYTIAENLSPKKPLNPTEIGNWRPFWGFTAVPFGKGWSYLNRVEAKNDEQLADIQLRGLKLMLRAIILTALLMAGNKLLYRSNGSLTKLPDLGTQLTDYVVPTYDMALAAMKAGEPYSLPMRWLALLTYFALRVTGLIVFGHKVIAVLRMAGYDAFRNTYRPFESTSIAEFYNRIYYYFKELLVTFFFYPTYLRYFKTHAKVRLFMATLAAAGLGNFLFHFLRDSELVLRMGPLNALWFYRSYAVYALILGCAISWSQLRVLARKGPPHSGVRKYIAIAGVLFFYALICIVEEPNDRRTISDYGAYFVSLFRP